MPQVDQTRCGILISPEEFLKELQIEVSENSTELLKNEKMLETTEKVVYSCLDLFPRNVSEDSDEDRA